MRILFAGAHPYLPQIAGGTQSNTHELAAELIKRGHEVGVLSGLTGKGWIGGKGRLALKLGREVAVDRSQGYPVYRSWFAAKGATAAARRFRPDVAIAQSGRILEVAEALRAADVPTLLYFHNVEFDDHGGSMDRFRNATCLANSDFTAARYAATYGVEAGVLNPLIQAARYAVESSRERVLFVNPHPLKGVDIALELAAACPDIPFDFVESWTLPEAQKAALVAKAKALSNITLHPSTNDMRVHYGRARILLIPSRWEETWGRVASEGHVSGIPALATRIGGLGEAVGPGGMLLAQSAPAAEWVAALRRMWDDKAHYAVLAGAALAYSRRPALDPAHQIDVLLAALEATIAGRPATLSNDNETLLMSVMSVPGKLEGTS